MAFEFKPLEFRLRYLADAYKLKGDIDAEIVGWKELVRGDLLQPRFSEHLADAYARKGDIDGEIATWKELVQRHPSRPQYSACLADAYGRKGDIDAETMSSIQETH